MIKISRFAAVYRVRSNKALHANINCIKAQCSSGIGALKALLSSYFKGFKDSVIRRALGITFAREYLGIINSKEDNN